LADDSFRKKKKLMVWAEPMKIGTPAQDSHPFNQSLQYQVTLLLLEVAVQILKRKKRFAPDWNSCSRFASLQPITTISGPANERLTVTKIWSVLCWSPSEMSFVWYFGLDLSPVESRGGW